MGIAGASTSGGGVDIEPHDEGMRAVEERAVLRDVTAELTITVFSSVSPGFRSLIESPGGSETRVDRWTDNSSGMVHPLVALRALWR